MGTRSELASILIGIAGEGHVYFQPPSSEKLKYPCIIYRLQQLESFKADNIKYKKHRQYMVLLVSKDADDPMIEDINDLPYCSHQNRYVADNLYHDSFILYY